MVHLGIRTKRRIGKDVICPHRQRAQKAMVIWKEDSVDFCKGRRFTRGRFWRSISTSVIETMGRRKLRTVLELAMGFTQDGGFGETARAGRAFRIIRKRNDKRGRVTMVFFC